MTKYILTLLAIVSLCADAAVTTTRANAPEINYASTATVGTLTATALTTDTITAATGTQSLDFSSGSGILTSSGDVNLNANGSGTINIGGENFNLYSQLGGAPRIRIYKAGAGNYVQLGIGAISTNTSYTLPLADGSSGQVLYTNGSGVMAWKTTTSARTSCSPSITVSSGTTDVSSTPAFCWREGDSLVMEGMAKINTTGGTGSAVVRLVLPSTFCDGAQCTIDTAKLSNGTASSNDASSLGPCSVFSAATYRTICPIYYSTTEAQFTNGGGVLLGSELIASSEMRFLIKVPIVGWN